MTEVESAGSGSLPCAFAESIGAEEGVGANASLDGMTGTVTDGPAVVLGAVGAGEVMSPNVKIGFVVVACCVGADVGAEGDATEAALGALKVKGVLIGGSGAFAGIAGIGATFAGTGLGTVGGAPKLNCGAGAGKIWLVAAFTSSAGGTAGENDGAAVPKLKPDIPSVLMPGVEAGGAVGVKVNAGVEGLVGIGAGFVTCAETLLVVARDPAPSICVPALPFTMSMKEALLRFSDIVFHLLVCGAS